MNAIEEVLEIINNARDGHANPCYGGTDLRSAEALAGEYVARTAIKSSYIDFESLDGQLEMLEVSRVEFNDATGLETAKKYTEIQ